MNDSCTLSSWTSTSVKLSWTKATPAGNYKYIYNYGNSDFTAITDAYTADVTGLDAGANYVFAVKVTSFNGDIEGNSVTCLGTTGTWSFL